MTEMIELLGRDLKAVIIKNTSMKNYEMCEI